MKTKNFRYGILITDLLWLLGALGLSIGLRYAGTKDPIDFSTYFSMYSLMVLVAVVTWTFLYFEMGLDGFKGGWNLSAVLSKIIVAVLLLMAVILAFAFLTAHYYSRLVLFYFAALFVSGIFITRLLIRFFTTSRLRSAPEQRCVILGQGTIAKELARKIASHPELPFQIVGFLFPEESEVFSDLQSPLEEPLASIRTLQLIELFSKQKVQKLIIAMPQTDGAEIRKLIAGCRQAAIQVYLVPQWYDLYLSKAELSEIDGLPLLSLQERNPPLVSFAIKRGMDIVLSLGILLCISPILAVAAFVIYSKKGTAFRTELRCGKDGIPFHMCRLNVERYAPTMERYERLLLRWSLTELPQLWNVLRGEMSLVGPRPESPERVKHYSEWQRQRLKVKAGVTGLAQVHGLREQHSSEEKAHFDLQYIFNWSPFWDLSLILQTMWTLLFRGLDGEPTTPQTPVTSSREPNFAIRGAMDVNRS